MLLSGPIGLKTPKAHATARALTAGLANPDAHREFEVSGPEYSKNAIVGILRFLIVVMISL